MNDRALNELSQGKTRVIIAGGSKNREAIIGMVLGVLQYHNMDTDYVISTTVKGICSAKQHITDHNDFIVIDGHKPSQALDYKPNIAVLSDIGTDDDTHTSTTYIKSQIDNFQILVENITHGGVLIYNEENPDVNKLAVQTHNPIRKIAYSAPAQTTINGKCFIKTSTGNFPVDIFGTLNLSNIIATNLLCQQMRMGDEAFYDAILNLTASH